MGLPIYLWQVKCEMLRRFFCIVWLAITTIGIGRETEQKSRVEGSKNMHFREAIY